jgi:hypothetical protein
MLMNHCKSDMVHQRVQTNQTYTLTRSYTMVMVQASLDMERGATSPSIAPSRKSPGSMVVGPPLAMALAMAYTLPNGILQVMLNCMHKTLLTSINWLKANHKLRFNLKSPHQDPLLLMEAYLILLPMPKREGRRRKLRKTLEHPLKLPH